MFLGVGGWEIEGDGDVGEIGDERFASLAESAQDFFAASEEGVAGIWDEPGGLEI